MSHKNKMKKEREKKMKKLISKITSLMLSLAVVLSTATFSVLADDCYLDEYSTRGSINLSKEEANLHPEYMSDYGNISWNIKIQSKLIYFHSKAQL